MIGKMDRRDIAKKLGVSISNLKRAFRGKRLVFHNYCSANPSFVRNVNKYYESHCMAETAKHFGLRPKQIDHIVHRYKQFRRQKQIRWTEQQMTEAVKMAGLVSMKSQAKFFKRPNAFEGSIKSLWTKRFSMGQGCINGLVHWHATTIVQGHKARYLKPFGNNRQNEPVQFRRLILWVDAERCLKPNCPDFIKDAVSTMANFQRWIWRSQNPKPLILKMIRERELA